VAAISAGGGNQFGHPHREVLDLLSEYLGNGRVYTTLEHGNIEFITDGKRLWVKTEPSTLESGTAGR